MSANTVGTVQRVARPTMKDVAALAGVGLKTVSRVVNGERHVSEATRIDPENLEAQVLWGDLFMEKYNVEDAEKSTTRLWPSTVAMPRH